MDRETLFAILCYLMISFGVLYGCLGVWMMWNGMPIKGAYIVFTGALFIGSAAIYESLQLLW